jgi:hypothetical protein
MRRSEGMVTRQMAEHVFILIPNLLILIDFGSKSNV